MDNIEQLINTISTQNFAAAEPIFKDIMASKINDVLDTEQIKVATSMFGDGDNASEDDIDIEDVDDLEDEDLDEEE